MINPYEQEKIRALFDVTDRYTYLNHCSIGPLPKSTKRAVIEHIEEHAAMGGLADNKIEKIKEDARNRFAKLINSTPQEIAFLKNTPEGISTVASGLNWKPGETVITTGLEFPANIYPWLNLKSLGVNVEILEPINGRLPADYIISHIDDSTRAVAISYVQFSNGFRVNLKEIGKYCREREIYLVVDAIQGVGVLPFDVKNYFVDFMACSSHKWLLSPRGVGIFYCRRELIDKLRLTDLGQNSVYKDPARFLDYKFELKDTAERFEGGMLGYPAIIGMRESLRLLDEIGIEIISSTVRELTDILVKGLLKKGYRCLSSRRETEWSGIVSFISDKYSSDELFEKIMKENIIISLREGALRVSPDFYNTREEIHHLLEVLPT